MWTMIFLCLSALWMQMPVAENYGNQALGDFQKFLGSPDFLTSFDKKYLAPLRLLHILALAYVLAAWPALQRIAKNRGAAAIVILGRNELPVFATGSALGYLIGIVREIINAGNLMDIGLICIGLNVLLLVAMLSDRRKRRIKSGSPLSSA